MQQLISLSIADLCNPWIGIDIFERQQLISLSIADLCNPWIGIDCVEKRACHELFS